MNKTRIKTKLSPAPLTRDEAELLVNDIALAKSHERRIVSKMDDLLNAIRAENAPALEAIAQEVKDKTLLVQHWAETNPDAFGKKKSLQFPAGVIGFRTGTPKLKLLRKWTWDAVLEAMHKNWTRWAEFIRRKEEVDKEKLIRTATAPASDPNGADPAFADHLLQSIGLKLTQEETFFIDPALTEVELKQSSSSPAHRRPGEGGCSKSEAA